MKESESLVFDRIYFQLFVATLRGLDAVYWRDELVVDSKFLPVFPMVNDLDYISSRVQTLAKTLRINEAEAKQKAVNLVRDGNVSLSPWIANFDLTIGGIEIIERTSKSNIEEWKNSFLSVVASKMEVNSDNGLIDIFERLASRVSRDLQSGGRLAIVDPIPGLPQRDIRDMWVDVDVSELHTRNDAFLSTEFQGNEHAGNASLHRRSRFTLFMDGFTGGAAIFGAPGAGKSTLLKWLASEVLLDRFTLHKLPLMISLRQFATRIQSDRISLHRFALEQNGIRDISTRVEEQFCDLGARTGMLLLLDGWDEVPSEMRPQVAEAIQDALGTCSCLVTSRPSELYSLPISKILRLEPLTPVAMHSLIYSWLDDVKAGVVIQHLTSFPRLESFARNPFILTALCGVLESRRDELRATRLPENLTELYQGILQSIRQHFKDIYFTEFDDETVVACERLAFHMLAEAEDAPRFDFNRDDLRDLNLETSMLNKVVAPSRLVVRTNPNSLTYCFLHPTVHEYLTARFAARSENSGWLATILRERIHNPRWAEVLRLLAPQILAEESASKLQFVATLKSLLTETDWFGLLIVRVAEILGEVHLADGGETLVGMDLRSELWALVNKWPRFEAAANALAKMDYTYLVERCEEQIIDFTLLANKKDEVWDREAPNRKIPLERTATIEAARQALRIWNINSSSPWFLSEVARNDRSGPPITRAYEVELLLSRKEIVKAIQQKESMFELVLFLGRLARCGNLKAVAALSHQYWNNAEAAVRAAVINQLGMIPFCEARDSLMSIAAAQFGVSLEGIVALDNMSDFPCGAGAQFFAAILSDEHASTETRSQAAFALTTSTDPEVIEQAAKIAFGDTNDVELRKACLGCLSANGETRHIEGLSELLLDRSMSAGDMLVLDAILRIVKRFESRALFPEVFLHLERVTDFCLGSDGQFHQSFGIRFTGILGENYLEQLFELSRRADFHKALYSEIERAVVCMESSTAIESFLNYARAAKNDPSNSGYSPFQTDSVFSFLQHDPKILKEIDHPEYMSSIAQWSQQTWALVFDDSIVTADDQNLRISNVCNEQERLTPVEERSLAIETLGDEDWLGLETDVIEAYLREGIKKIETIDFDFDIDRFRDQEPMVGQLAEVMTLRYLFKNVSQYRRFIRMEPSTMSRADTKEISRLFGPNAIFKMLTRHLPRQPGKGTVYSCQIYKALRQLLPTLPQSAVDRKNDSSPPTAAVVIEREKEILAIRESISQYLIDRPDQARYCAGLIEMLEQGDSSMEVELLLKERKKEFGSR